MYFKGGWWLKTIPYTDYDIGAGLTGLDLQSNTTWPKANN
jgi:hypothetical protein